MRKYWYEKRRNTEALVARYNVFREFEKRIIAKKAEYTNAVEHAQRIGDIATTQHAWIIGEEMDAMIDEAKRLWPEYKLKLDE